VLPVSNRGVIGGGALRITLTSRPLGLAITGEIDEFTHRHLLGALDRLAAGPGEIHFDLAGVEYCDLIGLRAIVGVTRVNGQDHSRRVVLHNVPPRLRTVLRIVGWDATPGLTIDEREATGTPRSGAGTDGAAPVRELRQAYSCPPGTGRSPGDAYGEQVSASAQ